jgi:alpha-amylase
LVALALVDHFYPVDANLADLIAGRDVECGDFALGTYRSRIKRESNRVCLIMDRVGRAGNHSIRIRKMMALAAGDAAICVRYEIENIPPGACLHFAVEINVAGMAGDSSGGGYSEPTGAKLGALDEKLDLPHSSGLSLTDPSIDFSAGLTWSQSAGLWCFPIETLSRAKGIVERIYQSSAVIPHWHVTPDDDGRWSVSIRWSSAHAASSAVRRALTEDGATLVAV